MDSSKIQLLTFFVCFDVPAFAFHLSMLVFILRLMRAKKPVYLQGFYVLYAAVSVVDLYYVLSVRH